MQNKIRVIGLTGSIGSGKSAVSDIIRQLGITVIDADRISRDVVSAGSRGQEMIRRAFGDEYVNEEGLDRKAVAALVFSDESARRKLNDIVHPLVLEEFERQKNECIKRKEKVVVFDCPLLLEENLDVLCDSVMVVYVPTDIQIDRIMKRDGMSREDAISRIRTQMSVEDKLERADIAIDNSGTLEELKDRVERLAGRDFRE